jgi:death-on-curing protein
MACNHGFADGNKRTTLILFHTLVSNSGYSLPEEDVKQQTIEAVILAVASRSMSFEELAAWFKLRLQRNSSPKPKKAPKKAPPSPI